MGFTRAIILDMISLLADLAFRCVSIRAYVTIGIRACYKSTVDTKLCRAVRVICAIAIFELAWNIVCITAEGALL